MKNSVPEGYCSRPARMVDLEATIEMFNADAKRIIGIEKFALQEVGNDWQTLGFNLDADTQIVLSPEGNIAGYYEVLDLEPQV